MTETWRSAIVDWVEAQKQLQKHETFAEQQRGEILSCLPFGADADYAIGNMELMAHFYKRWLDEEQTTKKREKILGLCVRLDAQLDLSDLLLFFHGDDEVWKLKRILESISGRKKAVRPQFNAKQEARNRYMEQVLETWLRVGGKLGGVSSPMVALFRAAWPKTLNRDRPTDVAIVNWAYTFERQPIRAAVKAFLKEETKIKKRDFS